MNTSIQIATRTPNRMMKSSAAFLFALSASAVAPQAQAAPEEGPWLVRGGISHIGPKSENGQLTVGSATVESVFDLSLNVAYYFNPHWAVDVLAALPFKHDFSINGANAGSTQQLPPTVTLQYHFMPTARIQPYAGIGLNYTLFFDEQRQRAFT